MQSDKLSNDVLLGSDVVSRLHRIWLFDQLRKPVNVGDVCDVGMNFMSVQNRNVNIEIMNNDISNVTLPVTDDDDDDDTVLRREIG